MRMRLAATPVGSAEVNAPPITRYVLVPPSSSENAFSAKTVPFKPGSGLVNGCHEGGEPTYLATELVVVAPDAVNAPPATTEPLKRVNACTRLLKPAPIALQEGSPKAGSVHCATRLAAM